ncbi:hypothetical protein C5167_005910 [Papaver somniferum]|uniref:Trichome birefringence-like N-terminal domain-containing protein n=1 Tax=Papaver somniferum TaxID=3469 RepID=A0A4Y7JBT7_PAPSO|nr:hypothetical protein C5167_005910 [Papaver somniferum]
MMLQNSKLEFFDNFFFTNTLHSKSRRNVISGIGYGVGISLLIVTLLFNYYSPLKPSSLLNHSSFHKRICFSKSFQNGIYISPWFLCHPNSTSSTPSYNATSELQNTSGNVSLLHDKETEISNVGVKNETIFIDGNLNKNSSILVQEVGDKLSVKEEEVLEGNQKNMTSGTSDLQLGEDSSRTTEEEQKCDIFDGQWVLREEAREPYYPVGSCPFVDSRHDCIRNRRPDNDYLKWQWQPNGCNISRLNTSDFLERMRGKKMVFVGDSLNRNMWESLVCMLWNVDIKVKKTGMYSVRFEDYNCSIEWVCAPFLVSPSTYFNTTTKKKMDTLRLDKMEKLVTLSRDADIMIFNSWHWWNHHKTGQNYFQEGNKVYLELDVLKAFEKALATWRRWIDMNIDSNKTQVVFRGYSDTHFSGGKWNTGGKCNRETGPISNETNFVEKYPLKVEILENALKRMKTPVLYLNVTKLTYYRADGHVSIYGRKHNTAEEEKNAAEKAVQDCNHWCVPGIPDVWNELLYTSLLKIESQIETNVTKTGFTNETVFNEELEKNSTFPAPAPAPEAGDNSLIRDGESVDATTNNDTGISVPVLGVHEEELVNNVTASSSDPQLGNYTNTTAIDSTGNATDITTITTANEEQECDIFDGQWVLREDIKPYYPEGSCPYIDKDFDCYLNKRPDNDFLKWQWQPKNCNVLRLNATDFLERMRGKRMLFIGDSLNRNMWESLNCMLRNSVRNKKKVYEISGRMEFKKKGVASIKYEDYNCYIDFVHAPFLVSESKYFNTTNNQTIETLRLDWMNKLATLSRDADFMIFNSWHWWNHFKTGQGENYFQVGRHVYPKLGVLEAYEKALATWRKWIDKNIDSNKTQVIFRSYSVTHFSGGKWNTGGKCNRVKEPILDEPNYIEKYPAKLKILEDAVRRMKTPVLYLNITRLTYYRADAHPSIYRKVYKTVDEEKDAAENSIQDCNHWCLPGIPDIWNELLYNTLLKIGRL